MRGVLVAFGVCGALVAQTGAAVADGSSPLRSSARIEWVRDRGAESCGNGDEVRAAVVRRLGYDPAIGDPSRRIEVHAVRESDHWTAHLIVRDSAELIIGARDLSSTASSCTSLVEAVVLAVVLAIDPEAALRAPSPESPPPSPSLSPAPSAAPASSSPVPEPTPPRVWHADAGGLFASALFVTGLVPGPAIGAELRGETPRLGFFNAAAGALFVPQQDTADGAFGFGLTAFWLEGCLGPKPLMRRVTLGLCLRALVGLTHVTVNAYMTYEALAPGDYPWFGVGLTGRVGLRLWGPLRLLATVGGLIPIRPPAFGVQGDTSPVFELDLVALACTLGVGLSF